MKWMIVIVFCGINMRSLVDGKDPFMIEVVMRPAICERESKVGDMLTMKYTGWVQGGQKFDSSDDHSDPFEFQLGRGYVIPGWDKGLLGMCKGEKRKLTIPPEMAYGSQDAGELIPAGSTLIFDTELVDIRDAPPAENVFRKIDLNKDLKLSKEELLEYMEGQLDEQSTSEITGEQIADADKAVAEILEWEDADKDGYVSHEEFRGPKHDEL